MQENISKPLCPYNDFSRKYVFMINIIKANNAQKQYKILTKIHQKLFIT